ncbi:hypothetical protein SPBRAN_1656 [uncultured Candidatus Thioglobus sp.]|nr:hypothetical protein SPBRAN_1656 [uncultured Candidatus Thioglobus sp.]
MNWRDIFNKNNANYLVLAAAVLVFFVFILSVVLLNSTNTNLNQKLTSGRDLGQSLLELKASTPKPKLSAIKAKRIISKTYDQLKRKNIRIDGKKIVFSSLKMPFVDLLYGLEQLKNKHNIVLTDAQIERVDSGVVEVKMSFVYP